MTQHTTTPWPALTRTFAASRETLWRMSTDPDEFAAWYGQMAPLSTCPNWICDQVRRSVSMRFEMPRGPMTMTFVGEFREVVRPMRLVYTESHSDDGGGGRCGNGCRGRAPRGWRRDDCGLTHHGIPAGSPGRSRVADGPRPLGHPHLRHVTSPN